MFSFLSYEYLVLLFSFCIFTASGTVTRILNPLCTWRTGNLGGPLSEIGAFYYSSNCGYTTSINGETQQLVELIFVEKGTIWSPPKSGSMMSHRKKTLEVYGLMNKDGTFSYRSVFAGLSNAKCGSPESKLFGGRQALWKCFVAGSIEAYWLDSNVFHMSLSLPVNQIYQISLFNTFDRCNMPLEQLGLVDFNKCSGVEDGSCVSNVHCLTTENVSNPHPPAMFTSTIRVYYGGNAKFPPTQQVRPCSGSGAAGPGAWYNELWTTPQCKFKRERVNTVSHSFCLVGDSHIARSPKVVNDILTRKIQPKFVGSYVISTDLKDPLFSCRWRPKNISMLEAFEQCNDYFFKSTGTLIWWYGSHGANFSPADVYKSVLNANTSFPKTPAQVCVIVVGILDSYTGKIPEKFGAQQKYYQNSWRIKAKNDAIERAVNDLGGTNNNFHYVDFFEESLALHYDGHTALDPVHMTDYFYRYVFQKLFEMSLIKCWQPQLLT